MGKLLFTIWLLALCCQVLSFEFEDAHSKGVEFGNVVKGILKISLDEDNNAENRYTLCKITGISDQSELTLKSITQIKLDLKIEEVDGSFLLTSNSVDYEKIGDITNTVINVESKEDVKVISVVFINLDDEPPTITTTGGCEMNECFHYTVDDSKCLYTVNDPDGFLDTMDFHITNSELGKEDTIFEFKYKDTPAPTVKSSTFFLVLKDDIQLDYNDASLYNFNLEAKDGGHHSTVPIDKIPIIVKVIDIPNKKPEWKTAIFTKRITEKSDKTEDKTMSVSARDGDYGINNPINYKIYDFTPKEQESNIQINEATGEITIGKINRDEGPTDQVTFTVQAFEVPEPTSFISEIITLMIIDIDDNVAKVDPRSLIIKVPENTPIIDKEFIIQDIDLGDNAVFDVLLQELSTSVEKYTSAFSALPNKGYEKGTFSLAVKDVTKLDFENPPWRKIKFELQTKGIKTPTNIDTISIEIDLLDVNDEPPIFENSELKVEIKESIGKDEFITAIKATDKDAEDQDCVTHHILGSIAAYIGIENCGGNITTLSSNVFDYEKQTQVIIQIQAQDKAKPPHYATAQLTIDVIDVNDEDPRLLISSTIQIDENRPDKFSLNTKDIITAKDPDTTTDMEFTILWDESKATKNAMPIKDEDFATKVKGCIQIETKLKNPSSKNEVYADLFIVEITKDNTPDYEVFDTLYLRVQVHDKNTVIGIGTDTGTLIINIGNLNDNAPEFTETTKTDKRSVVENSAPNTLISLISAFDLDNDELTFSIKSANATTPEDWVKIDEKTGQLSVDGKIDCDEGPIWSLLYTVEVTDQKFKTQLEITIKIIDQNDNIPQVEGATAHILEDDNRNPKSTQDKTTVLTFKATDKDRDAVYNEIQCSFAESTSIDVTSRFQINDKEIKVDLKNSITLDREDIPTFSFELSCADNPRQQGISNPAYPNPKFTINLDDVNDNVPELKHTEPIHIRENMKKDEKILPAIEGIDNDEADNGRIEFSILKIEQVQATLPHSDSSGLFIIDPLDKDKGKTATILINQDLKDHYGHYKLTIKTEDFGKPQHLIKSDNELEIIVGKYNYKPLNFLFPDKEKNKKIYLRNEQDSESQLKQYDGTALPNIKVDNQDGKYSFEFKLTDIYFDIENLGGNEGRLKLKTNKFDNHPRDITITAQISGEDTAIIDGELPHSTTITTTIQYFDLDDDPTYEKFTYSCSMKEDSKDVTCDNPMEVMPMASYPDTIEIKNLSKYYLMTDKSNKYFTVDVNTAQILLKEPLDFETETDDHLHTFTIQSSSSDTTLKQNAKAETKLVVTVKTIDVNDNPPVFDNKIYFGSIITNSPRNINVLRVHATDVDTTSENKLRYTIDEDSVKTSDPSLPQSNPFSINLGYGNITSNFDVANSMKGFYTFSVTVFDEEPENHQDNATVTIFVVTTDNTVTFRFGNDANTVAERKEDIEKILDDQFKDYKSHSEIPKDENPGADSNKESSSALYFIEKATNKPSDGITILKLVTNPTTFASLKEKCLNVQLLLLGFENDTKPGENLEAILKVWLIGVSVVLGVLCLILLIAFILKVKSLKKRIANLSVTKFGSQESGLNRQGMPAPNTNRHAVEGSNPVFDSDINNKDNLDTRRSSVASGDSDLVGVENNDEFEYSNKKY